MVKTCKPRRNDPYQGIRPPRCDCEHCWEIYNSEEAVRRRLAFTAMARKQRLEGYGC